MTDQIINTIPTNPARNISSNNRGDTTIDDDVVVIQFNEKYKIICGIPGPDKTYYLIDRSFSIAGTNETTARAVLATFLLGTDIKKINIDTPAGSTAIIAVVKYTMTLNPHKIILITDGQENCYDGVLDILENGEMKSIEYSCKDKLAAVHLANWLDTLKNVKLCVLGIGKAAYPLVEVLSTRSNTITTGYLEAKSTLSEVLSVVKVLKSERRRDTRYTAGLVLPYTTVDDAKEEYDGMGKEEQKQLNDLISNIRYHDGVTIACKADLKSVMTDAMTLVTSSIPLTYNQKIYLNTAILFYANECQNEPKQARILTGKYNGVLVAPEGWIDWKKNINQFIHILSKNTLGLFEKKKSSNFPTYVCKVSNSIVKALYEDSTFCLTSGFNVLSQPKSRKRKSRSMQIPLSKSNDETNNDQNNVTTTMNNTTVPLPEKKCKQI